MEAVESNTIRYPIEIFQKYKTSAKNSKPYILNEFEFGEENLQLSAKLKCSNILNNPEIKANLNFLINRKNMSGQDEDLYDQININLNKINDKNFSEIADEIMNLPYTKAKHIYRLSESILIKGIKEPMHAEKYARLSMSLIPCYIEINDNKVYFRPVLLSICQDIFNELIFDPEYDLQVKKKHEYDRQISYESLELSGLNNFFGELNKVEILPNQVISFCFDKLVKCIERGNAKDNKYEGIKNLVSSSVKNIKEKDAKIYNDMKTKIQNLIDNKKFGDIKHKFHLMEAIELF
jgi:hypothetical protein